MIQYNRSTNSGTPLTPYAQPTTSQDASKRKRGGAAAWVWLAVLLGYAFISRVATGGGAYIAIIGVVIVFIAVIAAVIIRSAKKGGAGVTERRSSQDGHICESPSEHTASERSAASTLDEMESGYRAYSYSAAENSAHESYVYKRIKKMTPEEYRKKLEELDSLLEAGMMTREEHTAKKREYAAATRGY